MISNMQLCLQTRAVFSGLRKVVWLEGEAACWWIQEADAVKINMKLISLTRPWIAENDTGFRWAAEPNCETETMLGGSAHLLLQH